MIETISRALCAKRRLRVREIMIRANVVNEEAYRLRAGRR